MKILIVADEQVKRFYEHYEDGILKPYDLILSCGDLEPEYLSFIATMSRAAVLYVHGNHDEVYNDRPPEGCISVEDEIYNFRGLRILGLGGSMKYRETQLPETQHTEKEQARRIRKLSRKLRKNKGFDILLAHAPAAGLNDAGDPAHRGFQCFNTLMDQYQPAYFIHGHVHGNYGKGFKRLDSYGKTTVINGWQYYELEIPDPGTRS